MTALRHETAGKLVQQWVYAYRGKARKPTEEGSKDLAAVSDQKVTVRVYLVSKLEKCDSPPHATGATHFRVECDSPKFQIEGTDIEALRTDAFGRCDRHYATKWEPYFLVEVAPGLIMEGLGSGIDFSYRTVYRGIGHDGSILLKEHRWGSREDNISPWPGEFRSKGGRLNACIPATKKNQTALEEFSRRIDELRKAIGALLRPEIIAETLASLSSLSLLPPDRGRRRRNRKTLEV